MENPDFAGQESNAVVASRVRYTAYLLSKGEPWKSEGHRLVRLARMS